MQRIETALPGVFILEPRVFDDNRGFFFETYNRDTFAKLGIEGDFVQDNHSKSERGALRGLHYQLNYPQAKLCRVIQGEVWDVAVDIRRGSPTFGQFAAGVLSAENKRQIYIPRGFAHGFLVLSETAEFLYKCDDFYHPEDQHGIIWNDTTLNIEWNVEKPILSPKDTLHPLLENIAPELLPVFKAL